MTRRKLITGFIIIFICQEFLAQITCPASNTFKDITYPASKKWISHHRFLTEKKFPILHTVNEFNFDSKRIKIELYDLRDSLNLEQMECSKIPLRNSSEFSNAQGFYKIWEYINKIAVDSKLLIDENSQDVYIIRIMALDFDLSGNLFVGVHGLCQIKVIHDAKEKVYCVDLKDGDKNSPLTESSIISSLSASRVMISAAIREVLEKFLIDLKSNSI